MGNVYFADWIVVPFYATGSSWDGTRQFTWQAVPGERGYRGNAVVGAYSGPDARAKAVAQAHALTASNTPF